MKKIIKFGLLSILMMSSLSALSISDSMNIDHEEYSKEMKGDPFHIHIGNNIWLVAKDMPPESSSSIFHLNDVEDPIFIGYEKKWRCPYCNNYYPMGKPCSDPTCPSRFR